jgi:hypothetical protein
LPPDHDRIIPEEPFGLFLRVPSKWYHRLRRFVPGRLKRLLGRIISS